MSENASAPCTKAPRGACGTFSDNTSWSDTRPSFTRTRRICGVADKISEVEMREFPLVEKAGRASAFKGLQEKPFFLTQVYQCTGKAPYQPLLLALGSGIRGRIYLLAIAPALCAVRGNDEEFFEACDLAFSTT